MDTNPPIPAEGKPLAALEDKRGIPARASFNIIDPTSDTADLQPGAVIKGDKRGIPARASFTILDPTSDTSELKAETA
ncbi:hypothetical protein BC835DRAFT_546714 [Cytidiella melzeri]|nr:hypothetical protein BC835DRAFT_546714 [Cytidiella melzeri]